MNNQLNLFPIPVATVDSTETSLKASRPAGKPKLILSLQTDVQRLFEILKASHYQFVFQSAQHLKAHKDALVYCAEFFQDHSVEEGHTLKARIKIFGTMGGYYRVDPFDTVLKYEKVTSDLIQHVNVCQEWMIHNRLWFRQDNQGEFEAFVQYREEFRDSFCINPNRMLSSFCVTL